MKIMIEPLAIGGVDGPRVFIVIRQVGRHKDIEEAPESARTAQDAVAFAAKRWQVPEKEVELMPTQVVFLESQP